MTAVNGKPKLVQISAMVREDHWEQLQALAAQNETTPSLELRRVLKDGFEHREREAAAA